MKSEIEIVPLSRSPREVSRFLQVSYTVYRGDPCWVAPVLMDAKTVFSDRNPLFEHAEMRLWVARREGRDVGRIAGILDHHHNQRQHDSAAFFGFFETLNDAPVATRLFEAVVAWAKAQGARRVLGPMNPTTNDECGLLVEGFDSPPALMMTYNPPYYADLVRAAGFRKVKDLLAFYIDLAQSPRARLERIAARSVQRLADLRIRPIRRKTLHQDLNRIKEVYNGAWEQNWGFVPMTDGEIDFMAQRLKPLLAERLVYLAETATEPAAFLLALPDYNEAFQPLRGRLLTPGLFRALPYFLGWKRPRLVRLLALGIKPKFRKRGLEAAMIAEGLKFAAEAGFGACEASWILEDNLLVQRLIGIFGGRAYKTYRLYERDL
ncbi:MAG: N-acetyltransferase [Verrucomicrobia bacterium]|nr:N-acetyltransferase [Verrucomicrobiota bacterium]